MGERDEPATTGLGDWMATLVFARPVHLVVGVSEQTLLPVLLPAAPLSELPTRFARAVAQMLIAIGVSEGTALGEVARMTPVLLGQTRDRRVLGTLNDFVRMLPDDMDQSESLLEAALRLADAPCSVLGMESPRRATMRRLNVLH